MNHTRQLNERRFHDAQASQRAITYARDPARLRFKDRDYLKHAPWIRPAFLQINALANRDVLDLGCGHGMAAVVFARRGANVSACDLSPGYIAEANLRAKANEAIISFTVCAAEQLPYDDNAFDLVWGNAILHHLDLPLAMSEIRRVLRPNGLAVFCEPWDGNPVVRWMRRLRRHTKDEKALAATDVALMQSQFNRVSIKPFQFGRYVVITLR